MTPAADPCGGMRESCLADRAHRPQAPENRGSELGAADPRAAWERALKERNFCGCSGTVGWYTLGMLSSMLLAWEDSQMLLRALGDVAAGACALLFLAAALGKLDSWEQWSRLTKEIPGPAVLGRAVLVIVPAVESAVVVLCFTWPAAGLASGTAVLAVFALAVWLLARRLSGRECGCFGAIAPATIGPRLAARNAALAIVAAAGWYVAWHENLPRLSLGQVLVTVLAGAIALMLFQYRRLRQAAVRPASSTPGEIE